MVKLFLLLLNCGKKLGREDTTCNNKKEMGIIKEMLNPGFEENSISTVSGKNPELMGALSSFGHT